MFKRVLSSLLLVAACGEVAPAISDDQELPTAFTVQRNLSGTIGYTDADGVAAAVRFSNGGRAVQCRVGHVSAIDGIAFADCPAAASDGTITVPVVATSGHTDGSYRLDIQYLDEDGLTKNFNASFYVHRSLNGAAACPDDAATFPTDDAFFAAAVQPFTVPAAMKLPPSWIDGTTHTGTLPTTTTFGNSDVTAPFYSLHFSGVFFDRYPRISTVTGDMIPGQRINPPGTFDLPMWSLRHRITLNADKTLAIVTRTYESRTRKRDGAHSCTTSTSFGGTSVAAADFPCDALVVNANGEGFCMVVDGGVATQAVFSRQIVSKLAAQAVGEFLPDHRRNSVWGPKVFDAAGTIPDSTFAFDDVADHDYRVVLRP